MADYRGRFSDSIITTQPKQECSMFFCADVQETILHVVLAIRVNNFSFLLLIYRDKFMVGMNKNLLCFQLMKVVLVTEQQENTVFLNRGKHFVLQRRREILITC